MGEHSASHSEKALMYERNTRISVPTYDAIFGMVQAYFRSQAGESASVLVVGAGGGQELAAWGPSNPRWTFTGVDPSAEMLAIAKDRAVQHGLEDRVRLIQGTVDDLPVSEAQFDAGSCILVLHFIHDEQAKLALLGAIREHMKPGAPFVLVSAYGDRSTPEFQTRLAVWKSFLLDGGYDPAKADAAASHIVTGISFISEQQIEGLLAEAGFTRITRFYSTGLFGGWICHVI